MTWFSANILFKASTSGRSDDDALWEERIAIVGGDSFGEAKDKAECFAKAEEMQYVTIGGEALRWEFVRVGKLVEIRGDAFEQGLEIFSRYLKGSEVASMDMPFDA